MVLLLNISYKKGNNTKKRYTVGLPATHMQAVELVILLLTFAVTFLLQEDFFLVGTSRA